MWTNMKKTKIQGENQKIIEVTKVSKTLRSEFRRRKHWREIICGREGEIALTKAWLLLFLGRNRADSNHLALALDSEGEEQKP